MHLLYNHFLLNGNFFGVSIMLIISLSRYTKQSTKPGQTHLPVIVFYLLDHLVLMFFLILTFSSCSAFSIILRYISACNFASSSSLFSLLTKASVSCFGLDGLLITTKGNRIGFLYSYPSCFSQQTILELPKLYFSSSALSPNGPAFNSSQTCRLNSSVY